MQRWTAMEARELILSWLRRRRERARRIEEEAGMLVRELGPDSYAEARLMQRRAKSTGDRKYWRDVTMAVVRIARKRVSFREFGDGREPGTREREPREADPIDQLKRLVSEQEAEPTQGKAPMHSTRRIRPERRK
jgi:hypothetical protein